MRASLSSASSSRLNCRVTTASVSAITGGQGSPRGVGTYPVAVASTPIQLPAGVTVGPGRETSQATAGGQIVQGMVFPITTPLGSVTSVFIPYNQLSNVQHVQQAITSRVNSIIALGG